MSFIGVFSILKCKTLVLKTTTSRTRASHFVDGWHLQRCQIRFFPHPLNGWHDHSTYNGVRFLFSALYAMSDLFTCFFLSKSGCRTVFLKSPITPSKVKWSAAKIHQTLGQLTGSDLSIISKGFWNNCWFPHDVTKIQTTKLSILPRFYFHDVLEEQKNKFHTNFRFKKVLGFVIEYAWISKLLRDESFTWRPRELSCRLKKWLISGKQFMIRKNITSMFMSSLKNKFTLL